MLFITILTQQHPLSSQDQFSELSSEATTLRGRLTTASAAAGGGGMWGGSMAMSQAMSQGRPSRPSRGPMEGG